MDRRTRNLMDELVEVLRESEMTNLLSDEGFLEDVVLNGYEGLLNLSFSELKDEFFDRGLEGSYPDLAERLEK